MFDSVPGAVALIIVGCMYNVVTLELIISKDAGAGGVVTLAQFAFVAFQGVLLQELKGATFLFASMLASPAYFSSCLLSTIRRLATKYLCPSTCFAQAVSLQV